MWFIGLRDIPANFEIAGCKVEHGKCGRNRLWFEMLVVSAFDTVALEWCYLSRVVTGIWFMYTADPNFVSGMQCGLLRAFICNIHRIDEPGVIEFTKFAAGLMDS